MYLLQVEIDYKAECAAGDTVECHGARISDPADVNGNGTGALRLPGRLGCAGMV